MPLTTAEYKNAVDDTLQQAATGGGHMTSTKLSPLVRQTTGPSSNGDTFVLRTCTYKKNYESINIQIWMTQYTDIWMDRQM